MKEKTVWFCSNCGNEYPKWMGRCPACGEWNTMVEQKVVTGASRRVSAQETVPGAGRRPQKLKDKLVLRGQALVEQRGDRPGTRWRNSRRLPCPDRRRTGDRQVHPLAPDSAWMPVAENPLCHWRGKPAASQDARRPPGWRRCQLPDLQ